MQSEAEPVVTQGDVEHAEEIVSAANIVSHGGYYYEMDVDAVAKLVARHREAAVAEAVAKEREACAAIAEHHRENAGGSQSYNQACRHIAEHIRARTNTGEQS
jgi:hypothetical protein